MNLGDLCTNDMVIFDVPSFLTGTLAGIALLIIWQLYLMGK